ncbi:YgjP-like metallopeptidase domain-containing protein [Streptomyces sp. NPDC050636]|uniref:YgjP-like metallopeptidase domain-containing protein n=1 Tax=Streptomyces sp. NPDC050636 TaxID=3154510 RepID=UPI00341D64D3
MRPSEPIPVGGTTITLKTSNRTTLDLDVTTTGKIVVRGPHSTTDSQAADLAERRRHWIYRKLTRLAARAPLDPPRHISTGETFTVLAARTSSGSPPAPTWNCPSSTTKAKEAATRSTCSAAQP